MRSLALAIGLLLLAVPVVAQKPFPDPTVSPNMPADVDTPFSGVAPNLPYFDDFSWQEFIALTWAAKTSASTPYLRGVADTSRPYGNVSGPLVWQTLKSDYEMFLPGGAPPSAWDSYASPSPCGGTLIPYETILASFDKYHGFNQAGFGVDAGPLISQNAQYVRYETRVNRLEYDFILNPGLPWPGPLYLAKNLPNTSGTIPPLKFPTGSIEIKAGWRNLAGVAPAQQATYFTTKAQLLNPKTGICSSATLGLVALHIINKTAKFPNWVWSTFEHADNVPAIAGETPYGNPPYGFNDNNPNNQKLSAMGKPITKCNPPLDNPTPTQVIRLRAIASSTQKTNAMYHADPHLAGTIWQNYHLTMTQWPINGGASTFPSTSQPVPQTNTANSVAETWFQASTATACMACHQTATNKVKTDFVWFLPLGAYNPDAPVPPCQEMNAFTLANKTLAMQHASMKMKAAAPKRTGHEVAIDALKSFFATHPPTTKK
ncbi:MAG TPA: hypothetical protein VJZ00_02405 [Thermoanaerobaculia bacterium]|nr:hypothetical protein [Thermoanaerobaculia bacterium]